MKIRSHGLLIRSLELDNSFSRIALRSLDITTRKSEGTNCNPTERVLEIEGTVYNPREQFVLFEGMN